MSATQRLEPSNTSNVEAHFLKLSRAPSREVKLCWVLVSVLTEEAVWGHYDDALSANSFKFLDEGQPISLPKMLNDIQRDSRFESAVSKRKMKCICADVVPPVSDKCGIIEIRSIDVDPNTPCKG